MLYIHVHITYVQTSESNVHSMVVLLFYYYIVSDTDLVSDLTPWYCVQFRQIMEIITYELEGNCDFSSNNNIWARFYEFLWRLFRILLSYFY